PRPERRSPRHRGERGVPAPSHGDGTPPRDVGPHGSPRRHRGPRRDRGARIPPEPASIRGRRGPPRRRRMNASATPPSRVARDVPLVVVAGNPNTGKTTVFNRLTGADHKVANYPGVTVERHSARMTLARGDSVDLVDVPGTY